MQRIDPSDLEHVTTLVGARWQRLTGKRIFLTGGTGFVGKWLLHSWLHACQTYGLQGELMLLSRNPAAFAASYPELATAPGVRLWPGDIRDFAFPDARCDVLIHGATDIAAPGEALDVLDTCIAGTYHLMRFAAQCGAQELLLISSGAVYGAQPSTLARLPEDWQGSPDPLQTGSAYGLGKRTAEYIAVQTGRILGIRTHIARCFAFVGPYLPLDKHFAIGNFIRDALQGRDIIIEGDGTPLRSYLYSADLAAWLWIVLLDGADGTAYNVGGDTAMSIVELAHAVNHALGTTVDVVCRKPATNGIAAQRYLPDVSKAERELGLVPRVALTDAIQRTARWAALHH